MIVDSSAVMAVVEDEPGAPDLLQTLLAAPQRRMSVATWVELGIVADRRSTAHGHRLDQLLEVLEVELVPVSVAHARVAREAHRRFGRGGPSPARLNHGDCFSYALAITTGEPLLFVGDDFTHTDVHAAPLAPPVDPAS